MLVLGLRWVVCDRRRLNKVQATCSGVLLWLYLVGVARSCCPFNVARCPSPAAIPCSGQRQVQVQVQVLRTINTQVVCAFALVPARARSHTFPFDDSQLVTLSQPGLVCSGLACLSCPVLCPACLAGLPGSGMPIHLSIHPSHRASPFPPFLSLQSNNKEQNTDYTIIIESPLSQSKVITPALPA